MKTMVYASVFLSLRRHSKELTSFSSTVQMRQRFMFRPQVFSLVVQRRLVPSLHSNDPQHNQQHAHANLETHVRTRTEKNELMVTTDVIFVEEWTSQSINQSTSPPRKQASNQGSNQEVISSYNSGYLRSEFNKTSLTKIAYDNIYFSFSIFHEYTFSPIYFSERSVTTTSYIYIHHVDWLTSRTCLEHE